jgi:tripartite-type tricarboxylate transporter receptor subunit TctC
MSDTIMPSWMRQLKSNIIFFGVCAASLLAAPGSIGINHTFAADNNTSFAGQTVAMTIGFGAGGGVDLYGRTLGRFLVRYLPGQPALVVINQLGAGGVVALNDWANKAPVNGLFVTIGAHSQIDPDALMQTHAKFTPSTFNFVGGLAAYSQGLFVNKDAVARLYDKSAKPVVMGIVGSTLRSGNYQVLWGATFLNWNVRWVRGYTSTAELRQAMERGEIDMTTFGASADIAYLLSTGKFTIVSQSGGGKEAKQAPRPILGDAPSISDLVKGKISDPLAQKVYEYGQNVSQVGMWLALPPGTPDRIVATYVRAFDATTKDPEYQAEFAKIDPDSPVAGKAELENLVHELARVSPETLTYLQTELKAQGFETVN